MVLQVFYGFSTVFVGFLRFFLEFSKAFLFFSSRFEGFLPFTSVSPYGRHPDHHAKSPLLWYLKHQTIFFCTKSFKDLSFWLHFLGGM